MINDPYVVITLPRSGGAIADLTIYPDTNVMVTKQLSINTLINIFPRLFSPISGEEVGDRDYSWSDTTRLQEPDRWDVNLFPQWPYARIGLPKRNCLTVGGLPEREQQIKWLNQNTTFTVTLPPRVWVCTWINGRLTRSCIFTVPRFPSNVNDNMTVMHPWSMANADQRGDTCWGTTIRPEFGSDASCVGTVDREFFASAFSTHLYRSVSVEDGDGRGSFYRWWTRTKPTCPPDLSPLVPHDTNYNITLDRAIAWAAENGSYAAY